MYECVICHSEEVDEDDRPCMFCYYTGAYFNWALRREDRSNMLSTIESIPQVKRTAVWHHSGGNFQLAVSLEDGRILFLGAAAKAFEVSMSMEDDESPEVSVTKFIAPVIPPVGIAWGVAVMSSAAESSDDVVIMPDQFETDEDVIRAIRQVASLNALMEES